MPNFEPERKYKQKNNPKHEPTEGPYTLFDTKKETD